MFYISISKMTIHLGMHLHLVAHHRYRKSMEDTKILIEEEMSHILDAKISTIFLITNKCFWP
jgi:hypothetical protein